MSTKPHIIVPAQLHIDLKVEAARQQVTLTKLASRILQEYLDKLEKPGRTTRK